MIHFWHYCVDREYYVYIMSIFAFILTGVNVFHMLMSNFSILPENVPTSALNNTQLVVLI